MTNAEYPVRFRDPRPTANPDDLTVPNYVIVTPFGEYDLVKLSADDIDWDDDVEYPWEADDIYLEFPDEGSLNLALLDIDPDVLEVLWNIYQPT